MVNLSKKRPRKKKKKTKKKVKKCKKKLGSIFTTKTVHNVDYHDWESFVNKFYGVECYDFVSSEECGNDSNHTYSPDGKQDKYEVQDIAEFVKQDGNICYRTSEIFNDLVAKGEIPAGNYCVNVCW